MMLEMGGGTPAGYLKNPAAKPKAGKAAF